MRWRNARRSSNVDDRRGRSGGGFPFGRGIRIGGRRGGRKAALGGGLGTIVVLLIFVFLGGDPMSLLQQIDSPAARISAPSQTQQPAGNDESAQFVAAVLGETEDVWHKLFQQQGQRYSEPRLVLFTDYVRSACGTGSAAMGPFYCPGDQQVYIDLGFFDELKNRFGAPGDFAQAYVIAHEVGHHVQNLLGISQQVQQAQARLSQADANALSVRLELQADYFAGVWAHHARRLLEPGDLDEALGAASAIGDDRLQRQTRGTVVPDSFTHGSSEQRRRWFQRGYENGTLEGGDTFSARSL
ncbi:MAG: neutral zinc metallopeptidase [Chthoniobacterales bacterium]